MYDTTSKSKIIKIDKCSECPHEASGGYNQILVCEHDERLDIAGFGMIIPAPDDTGRGYEIPDWCPLEEAKP